MSLTTSSALKAFLEAQGLGISVYQDQVPPTTSRPYISVDEAVALSPDPTEDGALVSVVEEVAVNLWMDYKNVTGGTVNGVAAGGRLESPTLPGAVVKVLGSGIRLSTSPTLVYGVLVKRAGPRILEREENNGGGIVHFVIQLDIFRNL